VTKVGRMVLVAHGVAFSICWDSHSSCVTGSDQDRENGPYITLLSELLMRNTVLSALSPAHDLFSIMLDYSDGVWPREMMQTMIYFDAKMLPDDTNSDDSRDLICVIMR
jgi:hypothetical protein